MLPVSPIFRLARQEPQPKKSVWKFSESGRVGEDFSKGPYKSFIMSIITNSTLLNLAEILHDELGGEGVHPLPHHALLSYDSTKDNHEDQHAAKSQVKD